MSLYTITFDDDEESSDSPMPQPLPVRKPPTFNRPPNIVTKPSPKPNVNRTPIQKMQMIITDSDSYDESDIKSIPTYGKQLLSVSREYSNEYESENSAPRSPKIHVKDIKTDSEYDSYSYEYDNQVPDIKPQNSQPQLVQNKSQPFQRQSIHQPRKILSHSPSPEQQKQQPQQQSQSNNMEVRVQRSHQPTIPQPQNQQPQPSQLNEQQQQQQQQQQHHQQQKHHHQQQQQQQQQQRPQTQKSQSLDLHQNQNKDFNQAVLKQNLTNEIANSQPEFPPIDLPTNSVPRNNFNEPLIPYRLQRTIVHSIRGKRTHYQLYQGGNPILHTKVKQGKVGELCITEGTETHLKSNNFKAVFLSANHNTTFSLRERTSIGKELMVIRYMPGGENEPKNVCVHFNDFCGMQMDFQNRKARLTSHNMWILDLKGRIALKSIKNCIVVDENNEEVMIVLKAEVDTLNIEAREEIRDIEAMAMGLSAFLCKK